MTDKPRLIEFAFPLEQTSIDSVHEKNVRHGHISTLHIWPARRPLAACRAALIATLLPDPSSEPKPEGMSEVEWEKEVRLRRQKLCERIGGKLVESVEKKNMPNGSIVERKKKETEGGILHWIGTEPSSGGRKKIEQHRRGFDDRERELEWFRAEIRKAYGGRAPRVLDPFAGGGAIPLEAMRLGCEATAADINPVAWFILKCTLEYPQQLAGKTHPLPDFILEDDEFMTAFYKAHPHLAERTKKTKAQQDKPGLFDGPESDRAPRADLAWHVRAWGRWVLARARRDLAPYYPTYADFEPLNLKNPKPHERQRMQLAPLREDGTVDIDALNREFSPEYLADARNPRWVSKPTVAYLWARTVSCKNCRATIPLLKTRWLAKKDSKRVLLAMEPNDGRSGVVFGIENNVLARGGNAAQKREHDRRLGDGTMSRSGAQCPCCTAMMTMEDLRAEGKAGRLGSVATVIVIDGRSGKEYRLPTDHEREVSEVSAETLERIYSGVPFGLPFEPTPDEGALGIRIPKYGFTRWRDLFNSRQLACLGTFALRTKDAHAKSSAQGYDEEWQEGLAAYLGASISRLADRCSAITTWQNDPEKLRNTFGRFALPMVWDFAELQPGSDSSGGYGQAVDWVAEVVEHLLQAEAVAPRSTTLAKSAAASLTADAFDVVLTDPPYYDAIPYSDLMDFFYIWLRRTLYGVSPAFDAAFATPLSPKWDHEANDGEFVDDSSRHGGNARLSKMKYEDGMAAAFLRAHEALAPDGRLVIVFAHKHPDAWETLVAAIIRAGFIVDGSWPIMTERAARTRSLSSAALSSSVWLVCRKRPANVRAGWDQSVLAEMRVTISKRLRDFWDAGVRGPDFVWAATGPGLEAYSKHPIVKKANDPGATMSVGEFLIHVRRMVVDFVIGQVLTGESGADLAAADRLDSPSAYYLLHRHDFGLDDALSGACILYATACGLADRDLESTWDLVTHTGGSSSFQADDSDEDDDGEAEDGDSSASSGSKIRLKNWSQRKQKGMGYEAPGGQPVPLIDRIHRLMHLWRAADVVKVDQFLDDHGLRRQELFRRVLQSLIELAEGDERSLLESISNHLQARGAAPEVPQMVLISTGTAESEE